MKFAKEIKVGLFAIGTITMFYMGFNYLKGIEFFSRTNRYYVIYQDVGGLTKSNPVTISGFNVGRVADIKLLQKNGNVVLVALDIDRNIILGDSAVAKLDANFLGEVSIVVSVGDILKPIEPLDTLHSRVDPGLTEMLVESAEPITKNLPVTIAKINNFLTEFDSLGVTAKEALSSFTATSNKLKNTLDENSDSIKVTIEVYKNLGRKLNRTLDKAEPLIAKFITIADSLKSLELSATLEKLDSLMAETTTTINAINNKDGTLGKLIYEDSLYQNLNRTLLDLDSMLIHLNKNPKHFFSPLGKSRKKIEKDLSNQQLP